MCFFIFKLLYTIMTCKSTDAIFNKGHRHLNSSFNEKLHDTGSVRETWSWSMTTAACTESTAGTGDLCLDVLIFM